MILSYVDLLGNGQRKTIAATVTAEHSASSYGQPVVVLADGGTIDWQSWVLLGYQIVEVTPEELTMLKRIPALAEQATQAAAYGSLRERRERVNMTLPASEVDELRRIGGGNVSQGVSRLLIAWRERQ